MRDIDYERYECWRSTRNRLRRVIYYAGEGGYYAMPEEVRRMGPWTDSIVGLVVNLKPEYRVRLARDMYVILDLDRDRPGLFHPEVGKG
jgi:hypothetical protein